MEATQKKWLLTYILPAEVPTARLHIDGAQHPRKSRPALAKNHESSYRTKGPDFAAKKELAYVNH